MMENGICEPEPIPLPLKNFFNASNVKTIGDGRSRYAPERESSSESGRFREAIFLERETERRAEDLRERKGYF
jgi:hypothetical protein